MIMIMIRLVSSPPSTPLASFSSEQGGAGLKWAELLPSAKVEGGVIRFSAAEHLLNPRCLPLLSPTQCRFGVFQAGGVMNSHVEDSVSERTHHRDRDTKGHSIIYAECFPPTVTAFMCISLL